MADIKWTSDGYPVRQIDNDPPVTITSFNDMRLEGDIIYCSTNGGSVKPDEHFLVTDRLFISGVQINGSPETKMSALRQFLRSFFDEAPGGGVDSVFGRTGSVTAQTGDYTLAQITGGGNVVLQGGNTFGATLAIGTNDNQLLVFRVNNAGRLTLDATGTIYNVNGIANGAMLFGGATTPVTISRNTTGATTTLTVNNANNASTGNIIDHQKNSVTVSQINTDGSMTFSNTASANGITLYNTSDQVTNTEFAKHYWTNNDYIIQVNRTGTGSFRGFSVICPAFISLQTQNLIVGQSQVSGQVYPVSFRQVLNASSATQYAHALIDNINQTGTAGYRGYYASVYEQSLGSGSKLLADFGTNSASNGSGTHTSVFSVSNTGEIVGAVLPEYADNAAAKAALGNRNGVYYRTGDVVKQTHP